MADRILLVLPPHPLTDRAKATLKIAIDLLQKPIICQTGLETTTEIHSLNLGKLETTSERSSSDTVLENCENPLAGEVGTTTPPPRGSQLDRIGFILGRWLPSRLVIDPLSLPFPFANNLGYVSCHSARLRSRLYASI